MPQLKNIGKYFLILALIAVSVIAVLRSLGSMIGNTFTTISNNLCDGGGPCPPVATYVLAPTSAPSFPPDIAEQLAKIDDALSQTISAGIAYNAPQTMGLNETITIELLLNPSVEPADLGSQVTEPGQVVTASIQVTPLMRAELISVDEGAFAILPIHYSPDQFISGTETTRWNWNVTAKEAGRHRLTLIIYRLLTVDGVDNWRQIETYRSDIDVNVTLVQRIMMLDWKWIGGIIVTALLIPAFWRYMDARSRKRKKRSK